MNLLPERQDIVDNESDTKFFCSTSNESISLIDSKEKTGLKRREKEGLKMKMLN